MVDRPPPPPPPSGTEGEAPPVGPPEYAFFQGILEGRRTHDDSALERLVGTVESLGWGRPDLELDGPRFSVLFPQTAVPGTRVVEGAKQDFIAALEALIAAQKEAGAIESTLRCTEVYRGRTVETLFGIEHEVLRVVGRVRSNSSEDLRYNPEIGEEERRDLRRREGRRALLAAAGILLLGGYLLWQNGWVERIQSADPKGLPILLPEFESRLAVEVDRTFGGYRVIVSRGPSFPDTEEKLDLWQDELRGARERIAYESLAASGEGYVHLIGPESVRLRTVAIDLQPLVLGTLESVEVVIPGHPQTESFALSPIDRWAR